MGEEVDSSLHVVGSYFNLNIFCNEGSKIQKDPKVMRGVMISIERMYPDQDIQDHSYKSLSSEF